MCSDDDEQLLFAFVHLNNVTLTSTTSFLCLFDFWCIRFDEDKTSRLKSIKHPLIIYNLHQVSTPRS